MPISDIGPANNGEARVAQTRFLLPRVCNRKHPPCLKLLLKDDVSQDIIQILCNAG